MKKRLLAVLVAISILALFVPTGWTASAEDSGASARAEQSATLTFTDDGIRKRRRAAATPSAVGPLR